ncbi:hypothetical protein DL766_001852 [Monosporascus sp. MC13-8B]|uniref:Protein kinase domain-containing protein n=1 Tax=Monosporascus cannonballus TaxID=155416 RepID=A0ABY0H748_9PEZI|nr:hypothetical protein DL762_005811 [Monosporascus cannonballus]RYO99162.1 hypothetical protein DL763_001652 [Monosporascus cannonballus]RYP36735.1 hypothetical protein DL766_001852 [Monosporascus sp. MC13-8B]
MILEGLKTKKLAKSAHCVQVINRWDVGKKAPKDELIVPLPGDDSSVDGDSSGDESIDYTRPRARTERKSLTRAQIDERTARWEARQEEILDKYYHPQFARRDRARRDFTILEYVENGDLANLIYKLTEDKETNGRVPNRVLWAFWLCQEIFKGQFNYQRAKANHMLRDLLGLGLIPYQEEDYPAVEIRYQPDDLNEEVPPAEKRWRRQRMVHFDLDPLNGDLELDPGALAEWDSELKAKAQTAATERPDNFRFVAPRPDRLPGEHEIIPRLKVADFGHSQIVKPQKRNWKLWRAYERMVYSMSDVDINHQALAPYTASTAATTRFSDAPLSGMTIDDIVDQQEVEVSYCPWLLDPDKKDYDWVDRELCTTIFECLNHKPGNRPTLETLLEAAKNGYRKKFHGGMMTIWEGGFRNGYTVVLKQPPNNDYSDAPIQTGDARNGGAGGGGPPGGGPSGGPSRGSSGRPSGRPPGGKPPVGGPKRKKDDAAAYAAAKNDPHHPLGLQFQTYLNLSFPHGHRTIFNAAPALRCGLFAFRDSIQAQLNQAGVALPSVEGLLQIFDGLHAAGAFDILYVQDINDPNAAMGIENNYFQDQLALILQTWGQMNNLELQLGYIRPNAPPYLQPTEFVNPTIIWILNNNVVAPASAPNAAGPTSGPRYNHWMGLAPNPAPEPDVEPLQGDDFIPPEGENGLSDLEDEEEARPDPRDLGLPDYASSD